MEIDKIAEIEPSLRETEQALSNFEANKSEETAKQLLIWIWVLATAANSYLKMDEFVETTGSKTKKYSLLEEPKSVVRSKWIIDEGYHYYPDFGPPIDRSSDIGLDIDFIQSFLKYFKDKLEKLTT